MHRPMLVNSDGNGAPECSTRHTGWLGDTPGKPGAPRARKLPQQSRFVTLDAGMRGELD